MFFFCIIFYLFSLKFRMKQTRLKQMFPYNSFRDTSFFLLNQVCTGTKCSRSSFLHIFFSSSTSWTWYLFLYILSVYQTKHLDNLVRWWNMQLYIVKDKAFHLWKQLSRQFTTEEKCLRSHHLWGVTASRSWNWRLQLSKHEQGTLCKIILWCSPAVWNKDQLLVFPLSSVV